VPAHKEIPAELLAAARAGDLRISNTRKGTIERSAVYRANYLNRRTAESGKTAREALGHRKRGTGGSISALVTNPPRYTILEDAGPSELKRAGRHNGLVHELLGGRMNPKAFERRVRSWAPIRGERFISDPAEIFQVAEQRRAAGLPLFEYEEATT